jgi:hypothetical protein
LLTDEPDAELVNLVAAVFLEHSDAEDQIAQVVRAIVLSEEFDATPARKLKRPFEFLASLYRATGLDVTRPTLDFVWQLAQAGWHQHEFRPPTGHSDKSEDWANTNALNGLVNLALYAHEDWFGTGTLDVTVVPEEVQTWAEAFDYWARRLGGDGISREFLELAEIGPDDPLPEDHDERVWIMRSAISVAALTPQFLFR